MGRPRTAHKDLPPGLYLDARRGYYYRAGGVFKHLGKVTADDARRAWVKLAGRRYEANAKPGTLAELLDAYEERGLPLVPAESTRKEYARQLPKLRTRWGERQYAKTAPEAMAAKGMLLPLDFTLYLEKFRPTKKGDRVKGATMARQDVRLVSSVFSWAIAHGYTLFNPATGCKMPTIAPRRAKLDDATRERIAAKAPAAVRLMMELSALTGMRKTDVRLLTVFQVKKDVLEVRQGKTGTAQEWEITPAMRAIFDSAASLPGRHKSEYVFCCRKGTAYTETGLQSAWRRARADAKADGYVFRDIRKAAINQARGRGDATDFAGHQDSRTTRRHYYTEAVRLKPLK